MIDHKGLLERLLRELIDRKIISEWYCNGVGYFWKYKEIAELEEENNKLLDVISNYEVKVADLEKQIEKMKADVKQGQSYWNSGEMQYDLYQRLLDKWEIKENEL